jgi:hypothetical protein
MTNIPRANNPYPLTREGVDPIGPFFTSGNIETRSWIQNKHRQYNVWQMGIGCSLVLMHELRSYSPMTCVNLRVMQHHGLSEQISIPIGCSPNGVPRDLIDIAGNKKRMPRRELRMNDDGAICRE